MQNKLYVHLMNSEDEKNLERAEDIRLRRHNLKCWNPEEPDCSNQPYGNHELVDVDDGERSYPMCKPCYESWIMG